MATELRPHSLDHVALWVDEREAIAGFCCEHLGMHVIETTDAFTLVGVDAKLGKLTLFDAEGPRERGTLERIGLRVRDVNAVALELAATTPVQRENGSALFELPGGVPVALVERSGQEFDLDHLILRLPNRDIALSELERMGFERRDGSLAVAERELRILDGGRAEVERPLLNHIALLVDSAVDVQRDAERRGVEIEDVKDAANTLAVFLRGPAGVRIEYVEHKPGFALV